jgi:hypothetical protein
MDAQVFLVLIQFLLCCSFFDGFYCEVFFMQIPTMPSKIYSNQYPGSYVAF